uniref:hypothetical protein n=1 Tax=Eubacterium sp. TaxID=142586 RepID=UPI004027608D
MAYFNGVNIAFSTILNGSLLDPEMVQFAETMKNLFSLPMSLDEVSSNPYDCIIPDFINTDTFCNVFLPNGNEKTFKCNTLTEISVANMFVGCVTLETVYIPACTALTRWTFKDCSNLKSITLGTLTSIVVPFVNCTSLKDLIIGEGTTASAFSLSTCDSLTQESLHGLIDNYADMTDLGGATITVGAINLAKITDEYKEKAVNKGLTLA